jgi:hypothetical protein
VLSGKNRIDQVRLTPGESGRPSNGPPNRTVERCALISFCTSRHFGAVRNWSVLMQSRLCGLFALPSSSPTFPIAADTPLSRNTRPPLIIARYRSCPTGSSRMHPMHHLPVAPTCRIQTRLPRRANHKHLFGHPAASARGAFRDRHERWLWDAMDATSRQTIVEVAYGEVVWFWRPDAGAKLAKTLRRLAGDGGKKARSPGRARRTPLRPSRREGRLFGSYLW